MCGLVVRVGDEVRMQALWQLHLRDHDDDLIGNLEALLQRCAQ